MEINGDDLKRDLLQWRKWFRNGQRNWSFVHHACLFGSIICSSWAGLLLQSDDVTHKTHASVLTTLAAVLTAMALSGGFERKWRSNRLSRSRIDMLLLDMQDESPNFTRIRKALKGVIRAHDEEIVRVPSESSADKAEANAATDGKKPSGESP